MGRTRQFDFEETLDVAVDTFWEHGFDGTAVTDLCKATGLSPASLYGAYGDKRALFLSALERYVETVSVEATDRLGRSASGLAAIRDYFEHLIDAIVDGKRRWGCLITNSVVELARREPTIAAKIDLHFARLETAFGAALARARASGELAPGVGLEAASFLVCVVQGINLLAKTRPSRRYLETIVKSAIDGLAANAAASGAAG
jgi:TetR/AcrR family transcriptional regulator, transcriptional repressor for nem operon